MDDPRQAFRAGFLARCVEDGLDLAGATGVATKAADLVDSAKDAFKLVAGKGLDTARMVGGKALDWGIPAAIGLPWVAGAGAGYLGAKVTDPGGADLDEVRDSELQDEYRLQTERLKHRRAVRDYLAARRAAP